MKYLYVVGLILVIYIVCLVTDIFITLNWLNLPMLTMPSAIATVTLGLLAGINIGMFYISE